MVKCLILHIKFNMASMVCIIYTVSHKTLKNKKYISYFKNRNFIDFAVILG